MTRRALVLGAGGPAAEAWEIGIIAGMADAGLDVCNADLFVGTSAGARVAIQVNGKNTLDELFERQLDPARRDDLFAQLASAEWPAASIFVVAVDLETRARRVFDRSMGIPLVDAVRASSATLGVRAPVTIDGRRYIDGGVWSADHADLASNFDRVLILTLPPVDPPARFVSLATAEEQLRNNGAHVMIVQPDGAAKAAFRAAKGNLLDPALRPAAACAGRAQGLRIASAESGSNVSTVWRELAEAR